MSLFIHEDRASGLDYQARVDLKILVGSDAFLTFVPGQTRPEFPGESFTEVKCTLVDTSLGATTVDIVANTADSHVFIFPKHYNDQYNEVASGSPVTVRMIDSPGKTFSDELVIGGTTTLYSRVYYDATAISDAADDEVYWIVKDSSGNCIDLPRYIILFHELVHSAMHIAELASGSGISEEVFTRLQENNLRLEMGLPERDYDTSTAVQGMTRRMAKDTNWCP